MAATLHLVHESKAIDFPAVHYVFVECIGNIPANAPGAWKSVQGLAPTLMQHNKITGAAALYNPVHGVYRAGFMRSAQPVELPEVQLREFSRRKVHAFRTDRSVRSAIGGAYPCLRDGFYIEHYLTDPSTTPAEQNVTAILFPLA